MNNKIVLTTPADSFIDGLPIGNGRIAAMLLGGEDSLRLALNHEWLWDNIWADRRARNMADRLDEVREVLLAGDHERGTELMCECFTGVKGESRSAYRPACNLNIHIDAGDVTDYCRSLDLESGVVDVCLTGNKCGRVSQQCFISAADGLGAVSISCERPSEVRLYYTRGEDPASTITTRHRGSAIILEGTIPKTVRFAVETRIDTDGRLAFEDDCAVITGATRILLLYQIGTSAKGGDPADEMTFTTLPYDELKGRHTARFAELLGKAWLRIDVPDGDLNITRRIEQLRSGEDVTLPVLFFNFGKYLMASSSAAELPMNLQGKWCEDINPPWESDYHFDVNLQMCYWFAQTLGMDELTQPLFIFLDRCKEIGRVTARNLYGCGGICFPLTADVWANVSPNNYKWDPMISSAAWCAQHYWHYWQFTRDEQFLRERAYPFIKEAATFFEDYLTEHNGQLVIVPSCSPENRFIGAGKYPISACKNSGMDVQVFMECIGNAAAAAELLGIDADRVTKWRDILARLPQPQIGSDGRLMEWDAEYEEAEPGHRHLSHLYGLYPGELFRYDDKFARACGASLDYRIAAGGGQTGWSRSWAICLMARLRRAEQSWQSLKNLICEHASPSLLDLHPTAFGHPTDIFQIDGNMGGTAAICEMLLQSYEGEITLLPARPSEWSDGAFGGFKAHGNITIGIEWHGGRVTRAVLQSPISQTVKLFVGDSVLNINLESGKKITVEQVGGEYIIK